MAQMSEPLKTPAPEDLNIGPVHYTASKEFCAVAGRPVPGAEIEFTLTEDDIELTVVRGSVSETEKHLAPQCVVPVYLTHDGGSLFVPTGRVFVRLKNSESMEKHRSNLEKLGFRIHKVLAYAPHSGWVTPLSGNANDALVLAFQLHDLPSVDHVEPQLLTKRSKR